jgi:hypothetical protein
LSTLPSSPRFGDEVDRMLLTMAPSSRVLDNTKQNRCDFNVSNPAQSDNALFGCECEGHDQLATIPGASGAGLHHRFVAFDGPRDAEP